MDISINAGASNHLVEINDIYNHYVINSNATFDTLIWGYERRLKWFDQFNTSPDLYHLMVATCNGEVVAFAYNAQFKEKQAYSTSSEVTVYVKPSFEGHGLGSKLYHALFNKIELTSIHKLYAAITIPNIASIKLHEKHGFHFVGTMKEVGFKNGAYHSVSLFEKTVNTQNTQN